MTNNINKRLVILVLALLVGTSIANQSYAYERNWYSFSSSRAADSLSQNADQVDTIMPQSYIFGTNLKLTKLADGGIHDIADQNDIKIVPLIYQANFDRTLISVILKIPKLQDILIAQLIAEAKKENYPGWQYDFENIAPADKDLYTKFVERTAKKFKENDLELSVAIIPRQKDYRPGIDDPNWSVAYDLENIAKHVDYVSLMTYDEPYSVGPTASLPFVKRSVDYALTKTTPDKLSLGIPMYCWKWQVNGGYRKFGSISQSLTKEDFEEAQFGIDGYNETLQSEWYLYVVKSGNIYMTWCDGTKGLEQKLDLINQYNLRGFSAWAIGQETPEIWQTLKK